jgi:O-antigen ligase
MIFSAARTSIMILLIWALFIWLVERRRYPQDNRLAWLAAFSIALVLSLVMSFFRGSPISELFIKGLQLGAGIAFVPLVAYAISNRRSLDSLLIGYLVSVIITSISMLSSDRTVGSIIERSGGLGGDPNHFAIEAAMALPMVALFFYTRPTLLWRSFLGVVTFFALAAIMQSLSRSALVAGMGMFVLWVVRFRRLDVLQYVLPVGVLLALGVTLASPEWRTRMLTMTSSEGLESDDSIQSRFQVGEYAFRAFASNPILGIGYKRFGDWAVEHRRYLRHADPQSGRESELIFRGQTIHNAYLAPMAEMGLLGLVPFLAVLILSWNQFTAAWRIAKRGRGDPELNHLYLYGVFLQLSYLAILIGGMFLHTLNWKTLWLMLGLSVVVLNLTTRRVAQVQAGDAVEKLPPVEEEPLWGRPPPESNGPLDPVPEAS